MPSKYFQLSSIVYHRYCFLILIIRFGFAKEEPEEGLFCLFKKGLRVFSRIEGIILRIKRKHLVPIKLESIDHKPKDPSSLHFKCSNPTKSLLNRILQTNFDSFCCFFR